jgi:hypothetical protein
LKEQLMSEDDPIDDEWIDKVLAGDPLLIEEEEEEPIGPPLSDSEFERYRQNPSPQGVKTGRRCGGQIELRSRASKLQSVILINALAALASPASIA